MIRASVHMTGLWLQIANAIEAGLNTSADLTHALAEQYPTHRQGRRFIRAACSKMCGHGLISYHQGTYALTDKGLAQMPRREAA